MAHSEKPPRGSGLTLTLREADRREVKGIIYKLENLSESKYLTPDEKRLLLQTRNQLSTIYSIWKEQEDVLRKKQ